MNRLSPLAPVSFPVRRLALLAAVMVCGLAVYPSRAEEEKVVDLAKLQVGLPAKVGATSEVIADELDGERVLKLVFPEGEYEAWRSSLRLEIAPPAAGNHTVTFQAKAEPAECSIEVRVWDFAGKPTREVVPPKSFKLESEWQEFVYDFTIENTETGPVTVTWGGLARSGKILSFRNVKLIKN